MSELKLLNCPFCGGEAEFVKMGIAKDIPLGFVRCAECGIRLRQGNCTEDFARDEWNRRTPMANIVEKLEALKNGASGCNGVMCENCEYNDICFEGEQSFKVEEPKCVDCDECEHRSEDCLCDISNNEDECPLIKN